MRAALLALLALATSSFAGDPSSELRFAPEPGTTVRKVWTSRGTRVLERLEVRTEDVTSEPQDLSIVVTGSKRLVVEDRYEQVGGGRPLVFSRLYAELDAKRKLETTTAEGTDTVFASDTCDVEGRSVRFRWNGARHERVFADTEEAPERPSEESGDARAELVGLAADMDFLSLLPPASAAPIAAGDTWPIDFQGFRDVLRPGGRFACTSDPVEGQGERELADRVWASLAGEVTARYVATDEARRLGRIAFRGTYTGAGEIDVATRGITRRRMETRMHVEGELVWDLELRHAHSLALSTTGTVTTTDDIVVSEEGLEREFERVLRFREESLLGFALE